jgi:hypothetical protein
MMTCRLRLLDCWARNQPSGRCGNQIACGNGHERAKKQGLAATKRPQRSTRTDAGRSGAPAGRTIPGPRPNRRTALFHPFRGTVRCARCLAVISAAAWLIWCHLGPNAIPFWSLRTRTRRVAGGVSHCESSLDAGAAALAARLPRTYCSTIPGCQPLLARKALASRT